MSTSRILQVSAHSAQEASAALGLCGWHVQGGLGAGLPRCAELLAAHRVL